MEYCCHVWAGAPSCYWELFDKLQKWICRTVGPSLAASVESLAHHRNVASLSLFYRYYFGRYSSELSQLVPLSFSQGRSTCYSRMSMSTVSFLAQLDSGILCLYLECFALTYDLSDFKSRINRLLLTVSSF